MPWRAPFAWRPEPDPQRVARAMELRVAAAALFALVAATGAMVAPGVRAAQVVREASRELMALRQSRTETARAEGELRRAAATLDRVDRFREQRGRTTLLLGALSQALPDSTALVSLRVDSLEGSFVALTPHAADILPQLVSITELSGPRIVGSIVKETVGGATVERATVRFKRPRPASVGIGWGRT
jgi:Tfp pilus assembly protein PilN